MRALVLVSDRSNPPVTSSRVRNYFLWDRLVELGVEVKVLGTDYQEKTAVDSPLVSPGIKGSFYSFDQLSSYQKAQNAIRYSYHQWPISGELRRAIDDVIEDWNPDIIHADDLRMAKYLPRLTGARSQARQTVVAHNIESELMKKTGSTHIQFGKSLIQWLHLKNLKIYEKTVFQSVDRPIAFSEYDKIVYSNLYGGEWASTTHGTNARDVQPHSQPDNASVLLLGSLDYQPNIDGLFWFLDQIFPKLPAEVSVTVAGSRPRPEVKERLGRTNVQFIDSAPSVDPLYQEHAVAAVPLLSGSGTRGKILESLAHERMVVSTTIGLQGLDIEEGEGVILADDPQAFADQLAKWALSAQDRKRIAAKGRQVVMERYDWTIVAKKLKDLWQNLLD